jgi:hypothetical protein
VILKAIALIYLAIGGLGSLAQAYRLLPPPDFWPLLAYVFMAFGLVTFSGLIVWRPIREPKDPVQELLKLRR